MSDLSSRKPNPSSTHIQKYMYPSLACYCFPFSTKVRRWEIPLASAKLQSISSSLVSNDVLAKVEDAILKTPTV
jgi:hypothetical protein